MIINEFKGLRKKNIMDGIRITCYHITKVEEA